MYKLQWNTFHVQSMKLVKRFLNSVKRQACVRACVCVCFVLFFAFFFLPWGRGYSEFYLLHRLGLFSQKIYCISAIPPSPLSPLQKKKKKKKKTNIRYISHTQKKISADIRIPKKLFPLAFIFFFFFFIYKSVVFICFSCIMVVLIY